MRLPRRFLAALVPVLAAAAPAAAWHPCGPHVKYVRVPLISGGGSFVQPLTTGGGGSATMITGGVTTGSFVQAPSMLVTSGSFVQAPSMVLNPGSFVQGSSMVFTPGSFVQTGGGQGNANQMTGGVDVGSAGKIDLGKGPAPGAPTGCSLEALLIARFGQIDKRQANIEARLENLYYLLEAIAKKDGVTIPKAKDIAPVTPITQQQQHQAEDTRRILAAVDQKLSAPRIDLQGPAQVRDALAQMSAELRGLPASPAPTALVTK